MGPKKTYLAFHNMNGTYVKQKPDGEDFFSQQGLQADEDVAPGLAASAEDTSQTSDGPDGAVETDLLLLGRTLSEANAQSGGGGGVFPEDASPGGSSVLVGRDSSQSSAAAGAKAAPGAAAAVSGSPVFTQVGTAAAGAARQNNSRNSHNPQDCDVIEIEDSSEDVVLVATNTVPLGGSCGALGEFLGAIFGIWCSKTIPRKRCPYLGWSQKTL